jgi:hypothetical protein
MVALRSAVRNLMGLQHPRGFGRRKIPVDDVGEALG